MKTYSELMDNITAPAALLERTGEAMAAEIRRAQPHKSKRLLRVVLAGAAAFVLITFSATAVFLQTKPRIITPLPDGLFTERVELSDGQLLFERLGDSLSLRNHFGSVEALGQQSTKDGCGLPADSLTLRGTGVPLLEERYWVGRAELRYGADVCNILLRISLYGDPIEEVVSQISGVPLRLEYASSTDTYVVNYQNADGCYCEMQVTGLTQRELVSLLLKNIP